MSNSTAGAGLLYGSARAGLGTSGTVRCNIPAENVRFSPIRPSTQSARAGGVGLFTNKVAVSALTFDSSTLEVAYAPLSWEQWSAVRAGGADIALGEPWPAISSVHLTIVTSDDRLLLTRRSLASSFFPGTWSASIEEGLEHPKDAVLADAVTRAVSEELDCGPPVSSVLLAVAREHDVVSGAPWGVVFFTSARLDLSAKELLDSRENARDASEHTAARAITLPEAFDGNLSPPGGWHPTSLARIALLKDHLSGQPTRVAARPA
jgi:hypothetical protein